jgi:hypothetical protein
MARKHRGNGALFHASYKVISRGHVGTVALARAVEQRSATRDGRWIN